MVRAIAIVLLLIFGVHFLRLFLEFLGLDHIC
eukprot:SAG22_NODE_13319_length_410_cov_1.318328_2_plen_31_part_01